MTPQQGAGLTSQKSRDRLVANLRNKGIQNERVLAAIAKVPRHLFVSEALSKRAYEDTALPIDAGQTISQPYIVARMTELVLAQENVTRVLEVGTGSGYQCAVLAELMDRVYSVERIKPLFKQAHRRLISELRYRNIRLRHTDGTWGWSESAPYEVILVTAAPDEVPQVLLEQLADRGRLIIPVGEYKTTQRLLLITRKGDRFHEQEIEKVQFVPMLKGQTK